MQLAADQVNADGGVDGRPLVLSVRDDGGDTDRATQLMGEEMDDGAAAILYVGPGPGLTPLRAQFERIGTPALLLGGDLYTSRGLFGQIFQTTIPWAWQAHVIGRYLVRDRKAGRIDFVGFGPEARAASASTRSALEYWGGTLGTSVTEPAGAPPERAVARVEAADAVVVSGSPEDSAGLVRALRELPNPPRIAGSASLLDLAPGALGAPSGTTACYTYTWTAWAEPIKRVRTFASSLADHLGHAPVGLEQEGYDAVRALSVALGETGGEGGPNLVSALEGVHETFSSFPVDLGPDDHMFLPRDELGLFAVAGSNEALDPWQQEGTQPWRALMRTFTYDGKRTNVLDRDKRIFFPFWRKDRPGPEYWRSRFGITTRPEDAVH
jgi:branched-chain amino acid transport system substrate-binding protein